MMKNFSKNKLLVALVLTALTNGCNTGLAATAEDFRTPEYQKMGSLDYIHAAEAYAKGYTGKGITLGMIDSQVRLIHPDFAGKNPGYAVAYDDQLALKEGEHGSHVAGIMTANKDDIGMHGVAFAANFAAAAEVPAVGNELDKDVINGYNYMDSLPNVRIINNSYGKGCTLEHQDLARYGDNSYWEFKYFYEDQILTNDEAIGKSARTRYQLLGELAGEYDKLYVISAGNSGYLSSQALDPGVSFFEPSLRNNTISVISCYYPDGNGKTPYNHLSSFSNMAMFTEENSITAPGSNINSTNWERLDSADTLSMSGTSMAAPTVSGVLGLVQEAFPYLSAKQLADVGLSTTSQIDYNGNKPFWTMLIESNYGDFSDSALAGVNLFSTKNLTRPTTHEEWKALIMQAADLTEDKFVKWCTELNIMDEEGNLIYENIYFYNNVPETVIFGQGLINADKATNGPGTLNALRLTSDDLDTTYAQGMAAGKQALYSVDTKGYNSVWSNDIGEKRVLLPGTGADEDSVLAARQEFYRQYAQEQENYHYMTGKVADVEAYITKYNEELAANPLLNLSVGLYKSGKGILRLTGQNTYLGASVAAGGLLQVDGQVAGDGYSTGTGALAGSGVIAGNVYNAGTLMPGSYLVENVYTTDPDYQLGILTINGNLNSNGNFAIGAVGKANSKVQVQGTANLTGGKIIPVEEALPVPGVDYNYLSASTITGNIEDNKINSVLTLTGKNNGSKASFKAINAGLSNVAADITTSERSVLRALNVKGEQYFKNAPDSNITDELLPIYYSSDAAIKSVGTSLAAEGRTKLLQESALSYLSSKAVGDRLDTFLVDGQAATPVNVPGLANNVQAGTLNLPVAVDGDNNLWLQMFKSYESFSLDAGNLQNKTWGGIIGYDRGFGTGSENTLVPGHLADARVGGFVSYGRTNYSSLGLRGDSNDWRVGLYGSKINGAWDYQAMVSYGNNKYDLDHDIALADSTAHADFKGKIWDAQAKARFTVPATRTKTWQVRPYGQLNYTHTAQDAYEERGTGAFKQSIEAAGNNSWRAEFGVEFKRQIAKNSTVSASVGYKRLLRGANPELNGSFFGVDNSAFTVSSDNDKNYLTYGFGVRGSLGGAWTGNLGLRGEMSAHSHKEIFGAMANYSF